MSDAAPGVANTCAAAEAGALQLQHGAARLGQLALERKAAHQCLCHRIVLRVHSFSSRGAHISCRLFSKMRAQLQVPPSDEFVYLRQLNKGPTEYSPYALQVPRWLALTDHGGGVVNKEGCPQAVGTQ